jgi:hypothetical protein
MKAILTKYHGPGNVRGARISAVDSDGNRVSTPYPNAQVGEDCHRLAAQALCDKMGWRGNLVGGGTKTGYAFCFCPALDAAEKIIVRISEAADDDYVLQPGILTAVRVYLRDRRSGAL